MTHADTLQDLVAAARRAGADAADAVLISNASLHVSRRLGQIEQLERAEGFDLGLRVFIGQRQAIVSSTDPSPKGFAALAERAVAMARVVPEDPYAGLADAPDGLVAVDLDLADTAEPNAAALIARAAAAEDAALAVAGVNNSEGASAGWGRYAIAMAASNGFAGEYARTSHSISVTALAGQGTGMERDYDYSSSRPPVRPGRRRHARPPRRGEGGGPAQPVPAEDRPHPGGLRPARRVLAARASGRRHQRRGGRPRHARFLGDKLGQRVMAAGLRVVDDPTRRRGLRSRPFDGEGMKGTRRAIVEDGILTTWILTGAAPGSSAWSAPAMPAAAPAAHPRRRPPICGWSPAA